MSTNLPPTAYIKMIDCWLIFSLIKPFVDIILQTYIQTLTEDSMQEGTENTQAWTSGKKDRRIKFCKALVRVIYPTFFFIFVCLFWLVGLIHYSVIL